MRVNLKEMGDFIQSSYYISHDNMPIGGQGEKCNDVILMTTLTALNGGKEILVGPYGMGKTSVCEAVGALLYCYPPEFIQACEVSGHPYQTEEKIFGRPDLGKINKEGVEKVVWSLFSLINGPKIVDEINRLPEGAQNALLNSVDRGTFKYLNEVQYQPKVPFYATMNYPDPGNTLLIPPLTDRFDVSVEVAPFVGKTFFLEEARKNQNLLKDEETSKKMIKALSDENKEELKNLRATYHKKLEGEGLPVISPSELVDISKKICDIKLDGETLMIRDLFYSDVNSMIKLQGEKTTDHYKDNLVGKVIGNLSNRWLGSVSKYSQSLAYAMGKEEVTPEIFFQVLPYTLCHRVEPTHEFTKGNIKEEHFLGSQRTYDVKCIAEDFANHYRTNKNVFREFYNTTTSGGQVPNVGADIPSLKAIRYARG